MIAIFRVKKGGQHEILKCLQILNMNFSLSIVSITMKSLLHLIASLLDRSAYIHSEICINDNIIDINRWLRYSTLI